MGDQTALEGLFYNMPSNDVYAILTGIPNRGGLSLVDLATPEKAKQKLIRLAQAGRIGGPAAQEMMRRVMAIPPEMRPYLPGKIPPIAALAARTGHCGAPPLPPRHAPAPDPPLPRQAKRHRRL